MRAGIIALGRYLLSRPTQEVEEDVVEVEAEDVVEVEAEVVAEVDTTLAHLLISMCNAALA